MTLPYSNVAVSPNYAQYQDAHYVDANASPEYHQNVVYNTEAPAYGHHFTAPNISRHTVIRTQASRTPDSPIVSPNRTVFLTKLPYSAVGQAVRRLLEAYGRVERCDVPLDKTSPNKIQGTAIAKFKETNDAARAIRNLNGAKWKGVTISARWDRDSASTNTNSAASTLGGPVQARHGSSGTVRVADARRDDSGARDQQRHTGQGPLIVNGSRGVVAPSRSRRGSKEEDSDSSDEDDEDDSSSDGKSSLTSCPRLVDSL
jgi:RNA recognition motif-containing protein